MNAPLPAQPEPAVMLDLELIDDCPYQKSRTSERGNLDELATSITQVGVLTPAIVRPKPSGRYELVAGHRRKRGSIKAGRTHLPCFVRELSDDQVIDIQAVENGQREGVHPLDEADLYAEMLKRGRTTAQIADKVGFSAKYVTQRLQLLQLTKAGREALDEDKLTLGAAIVLARVPVKVQDEALVEILKWHDPRNQYDDGDEGHAAASAAGVKQLLERNFMLKLENAPFPIDDASLVKKAGPCTTCPKRTGSQPELFADVASPDLCTDPACFKSKGKAYWPIRAKAAQDAGQSVLEGEQAKKALSDYRSGFKRLDEDVYDHDTGKRKDVRVLAKRAEMPIVLAQDPETGVPVELVRDADLQKVMKAERSKTRAAGEDEDDAKNKAARKREAAKARKRDRFVELAITTAVAAAEHAKDRDAVEALIIDGYARQVWSEHQKATLARRGVEVDSKRAAADDDEWGTPGEAALLAHMGEMTAAQRRGVGVELALRKAAPGNHVRAGKSWFRTLKVLGVNLAKIEKQVDAEEKERAAAKPKKAKPVKSAKTSKAK